MDTQTPSEHSGVIAWFARNHVAANLLMVLILTFGIISAFTMRKQTTPDFELNNVQISVSYFGAAPQEIEEGIVVKVEEAVQDIDGIVELRSVSREGIGVVTAEIASDADVNEALNEIKTRVDAISTFPGLAEKPVIFKEEVPIHVVFVSIYGDLDEYSRKAIAQDVRDDLMRMPLINQVEILSDREYEISVEISEYALRKYGLSMSEVSEAIKNTSVDLPGGTLKTSGGDILLRTEGQLYTGQDYGRLVLRTFPDGTRLTLSDVATINDGFVESEDFGRFNGKPTAMLRVLAGGQQNELATAAAVKEYIANKSEALPDGVQMQLWVDRSYYLQGRLDMMIKNMMQGALLVFLILTLFLRLKVALWVIVGIPVAFFGALWLMPYGPWPVTINVISLFGFILVLGIVVDDAIVIGESIYTKIRADGHTLANVVKGTHRVAVPATFGVLTTIAAFAPMLFVGGVVGPFFEAMAVVVILCLMFSLIESKLILPAHLVHARIKPVDETAIFSAYTGLNPFQRVARFFQRVQRRFQHGLHKLIHKIYAPLLERAIDNRGLTVTLFFAVLIVTFGVLGSGMVRTVIFPDVPGDFIRLSLSMQTGTAPEVRNAALTQIEQALYDVNDDYVAAHPGVIDPVHHLAVIAEGDTEGLMFVELPLDDDRPLNGSEITELWRERVGDIAGIKELELSDADNVGGDAALSFSLSGDNYIALERAAAELEKNLTEFDGVFDIRSSLSAGGEEIRLAIKPAAEALGLNMVSLGRQVRQAFYGEEAQRIQRGKDELKVMVRYPRDERRSVADLENMRIRTTAGDEVPFSSVADISFGKSYSSINRQNRQRTITVSADLDPTSVEPGTIIESITNDFVPGLLSRNPGVTFALEGASLEEQEFIGNLKIASLAALFLIYALIAIPLRSYTQPLIIMAVIPFGLIGAVVGHLVLGASISMFSLFGLIALAGVVVNDSLIMVDFINKAVAKGTAVRDAVVQSGTQRFRAIILTSLTTAIGLAPIITEKSVQAQLVIPMAISMSFGIVFATVITLFLIPALYVLRLDIGRALRRLINWLFGRTEGASAPVS